MTFLRCHQLNQPIALPPPPQLHPSNMQACGRLAWGPWNLDRNLSCRTLFTWYWSHSWRSYQYLRWWIFKLLLFFVCKEGERNKLLYSWSFFLCDKRLVLFRKENVKYCEFKNSYFGIYKVPGIAWICERIRMPVAMFIRFSLLFFREPNLSPNCWFPKLICHVPVIFYKKQLHWMVQLHANNDGNQWKYICYNSCKSHGNKTDMLRIYIYTWLYDA